MSSTLRTDNKFDQFPQKGPFREFSVVYTDRVYNLMSPPFQKCMKSISQELKEAYSAAACVLIPGSGTYAMEAVARQFGLNKKCMIIRNGFFSFRWTDINKVCLIFSDETVLMAQVESDSKNVVPPSIEFVIQQIKESQPVVVFAPHVETSTGLILPNPYIRRVAQAVHEYGGIFVLDGVASGTIWVDMKDLGVDVYITAPQKGWTGPCCVGIAMMSERAVNLCRKTQSNSFCCNLAQWLDVMEKYENSDQSGPGFRYYTTLPTDALMEFNRVILETKKFGYAQARQKLGQLGLTMRNKLRARGFNPVAEGKYGAPGVVVVYNPIPGIAQKFKEKGIQVAGGVPWKLDEEKSGIDPKKETFRIGLFGLDKLTDINQTIDDFLEKLDEIIKESNTFFKKKYAKNFNEIIEESK